eukprot:g5340.t1
MEVVAQQFGKGLADLATLVEARVEARTDAKLREEMQKFERTAMLRLEVIAKQIAEREQAVLLEKVNGQLATWEARAKGMAADLEETREFFRQESSLVVQSVCEKLDAVQQQLDEEVRDRIQSSDELRGSLLATSSSLRESEARNSERLRKEIVEETNTNLEIQLSSLLSKRRVSEEEQQKNAMRKIAEDTVTAEVRGLDTQLQGDVEARLMRQNASVAAQVNGESSRMHELKEELKVKFAGELQRIKASLEESVDVDIAIQKNRVDALERTMKEQVKIFARKVDSYGGGAGGRGSDGSAALVNAADGSTAGVNVREAKALLEGTLAVQEAKSALQAKHETLHARLAAFDEKEARLLREVDAIRAEVSRLQAEAGVMGKTVNELQKMGANQIRDLEKKVQQAVTPAFPGMRAGDSVGLPPPAHHITMQTTTYTTTDPSAAATRGASGNPLLAAPPGFTLPPNMATGNQINVAAPDPYQRLSDAEYLRALYRNLDHTQVSTNGSNNVGTIPMLEMPDFGGAAAATGTSAEAAASAKGGQAQGGGYTYSSAANNFNFQPVMVRVTPPASGAESPVAGPRGGAAAMLVPAGGGGYTGGVRSPPTYVNGPGGAAVPVPALIAAGGARSRSPTGATEDGGCGVQ